MASLGDDVGRRRIEALLRAAQFGLADTASTADEVLAGLAGKPVDVVLLLCEDLVEALDTVRGLRQAAASTPVVVVVAIAGTKDIRSAVDAGADGVVLEPDLDVALAATIHAVAAGQIVVPGHARDESATPDFSAREKQILSMVVLGFRNGEIARQLYLSESTVKSHLANAFRKLGVHSRKEATAVILDPDSPLGRGILGISDSEHELREPVQVVPGAALLDSELRVPMHVVHRAFAHETVIIDLRSGRYHRVNATGGLMLELLGRGRSPREAARQLAEDYERDADRIERDVCEFAADLLARGLIDLRDAAAETGT